jgi:hypothetical protein
MDRQSQQSISTPYRTDKFSVSCCVFYHCPNNDKIRKGLYHNVVFSISNNTVCSLLSLVSGDLEMALQHNIKSIT